MRYAIVKNGIVENIAVAKEPMDGDWVLATDGVSVGHSWDGVSFAAPAIDPAEALAAARAAITAERDRRMELIASGYTKTERETWPVQVEEAKAFKADPASPAPMLAPLAAARGLTVDQMADRVLGLNAAFATATGQIMGAATVLMTSDPIPANFTDDIWWT